ncbi:MAG: hypothetical protein AB8B36_02580 [Prochlorococcus sp.]
MNDQRWRSNYQLKPRPGRQPKKKFRSLPTTATGSTSQYPTPVQPIKEQEKSRPIILKPEPFRSNFETGQILYPWLKTIRAKLLTIIFISISTNSQREHHHNSREAPA